MKLIWASMSNSTVLLGREMTNAAAGTMQQEYASQYDCPSVLLTTRHVDADRVIEYAREIGAECAWECEPGEAPDLVITFAYLGCNEPEVYTEEAVRGTIASEAAARA